MTRVRTLVVAAVIGLLVPVAAHAQWDVEADPIAFALNGYSAHVGYRFDGVRLDVGAFGADVPEWLHGNDDWSMRTRGVTVKLDLIGSGQGFFAGLDADYNRTRYTLGDVGDSVVRNGFAAGGRVGYQFNLGQSGLYIAPWVSVAYNFGDVDVTIGDRTFEGGRIRIFPTVHMGWRF